MAFTKLSLQLKSGFASILKAPSFLSATRQAAVAWRNHGRGFCSKTEDENGQIASKEPFEVNLQPGKKYFWCRCGLSRKQPWCDGSHKGSGFTPVKFTVEVAEPQAFLCGCKQTGTRPFCDGTHATPFVQDHLDG